MAGANPVLRTRKNVSGLGQPGDDLDWYAKAVTELQTRPLADPTSWRYLAAVHGYPGHSNDPLGQPGDVFPASADQNRFWDQCQHQSWFFLPWHRGYLAFFEEIVAAAVVKLGGPAGWALPYWNYSDPNSQNARSLPPAFLSQANPDGTANPLWLPNRMMQSTSDQISAGDVDLGALLHSPFAGAANGGDHGFGGPDTTFNHFGGVNGRLEDKPHNLVHDAVGGLMGDPDTAALDPVFWLHHANIDRLWEVWNERDPSFLNPTTATWLTGTKFELHDSNGAVVRFDASQMQVPATVRHGYQYDDVSDPIPPTPAISATVAGLALMVKSAQNAVLVGASQPAVALAGPSTSVRVTFHQAERKRAVTRLAGARSVRAFLNLENVTGAGQHGSFDVYIDAPPAVSADRQRLPLLAGQLSTFGVHKASQLTSPHGGSGITSVLEITPLIEQLHRERNWDGAHLDVTFVKKDTPRATTGTNLHIGRVSVYYA